ncbi:MAG: tetratricopeptide repeat protein [Bacteroidetes bacterium]|nr:tetratricopeptide repeat protein [Bacteroidota bacterium]
MRWVSIIVLLAAMWSSDSYGQIGLSRRMADQLYESGDNHRAFEVYNRLLTERPNDPELNFNAGNSLYRLGRYADARKFYERALANTSDPNLSNDIKYNLANCDFKEKKLKESVEKYKDVLRRNASDGDARNNLEFAMKQMEQKPPPPSKGDQKGANKPQNERKENKEDSSKGNGNDKDRRQEEESGNQNKARPMKFTKEEAERILNALRDQEKEYQARKLREKVQEENSTDKDW